MRHTNYDQYIGKKFGTKTVLEIIGATSTGHIGARCVCDCGKESVERISKLIKKPNMCMNCWIKKHSRDVSLYIGKKFGKRTIIADNGIDKYHRRSVLCRCECGAESVVGLTDLVHGKNLECKGCQTKKWIKNSSKNKIKPEDYIGKQINGWIIKKVIKTKKGNKISCACPVCGEVIVKRLCDLQCSKMCKNCSYKKRGANTSEYIGQKFGKWTILENLGVINHNTIVKCQCECGKIKNLLLSNLLYGLTKSCKSCSHDQDFDPNNYINKKHGKWTIKKYLGVISGSKTFLCECECGQTYNMSITMLNGNSSLQCRKCYEKIKNFQDNKKREEKIKNSIGKKYGKLTIEEYIDEKKTSSRASTRLYFRCKCECGNDHIACLHDLESGKTNRCKKCLFKSRETHGYSHTRVYKVLTGMIQRCHNPRCKAYEHYGAKGIIVCDEWKNNHKSFVEWALNNGYKNGLTIDRIDPKGNYCPENCKWSTVKEQNSHLSKPCTNSSGYVGVSWSKLLKKWISQIGKTNGVLYIDYFLTQKEALEARNNYIINNNLILQIQEYNGEIVIKTKEQIELTKKQVEEGITFKRKGYIYKITSPKGKVYIGYKKSLVFVDDYWGSSKNKDYWNDLKKFGKENFTREIIDWVYENENSNQKENYYMLKFKSLVKDGGYNIAMWNDGKLNLYDTENGRTCIVKYNKSSKNNLAQ